MKQGYNSRLDETLGAKDGKESSKSQSMASRRHESEGMEKKDHGHKYGSDKGMSYRSNADHARSKVLKHMGGRGCSHSSSTDKAIKALGNPSAEGKYI
tara:strand:- start:5203 stop:5496 length:294 start_codon:yes stop_codon:yes gene_type:complete